MAFVPGTEIDKPEVDLTGVITPIHKIHLTKKALRRAGVPEGIITTFLEAAKGGFCTPPLDTLIADYAVITVPE